MNITDTMNEALACIEGEDETNSPVLLGDAIREGARELGVEVTWDDADAIARHMLGVA